jgi:uncharacterized protein with von Willebrand factor type A (vWA) domain
MLLGFFEHLRRYRVPVSVRELIDLLSIFSHRLIFADQDEFYFLSRLSLVKDEKYYDRFDQAFASYFSGLDDWVGVFEEDESEQLRELLARVREGNEREVALVMAKQSLKRRKGLLGKMVRTIAKMKVSQGRVKEKVAKVAKKVSRVMTVKKARVIPAKRAKVIKGRKVKAMMVRRVKA